MWPVGFGDVPNVVGLYKGERAPGEVLVLDDVLRCPGSGDLTKTQGVFRFGDAENVVRCAVGLLRRLEAGLGGEVPQLDLLETDQFFSNASFIPKKSPSLLIPFYLGGGSPLLGISQVALTQIS